MSPPDTAPVARPVEAVGKPHDGGGRGGAKTLIEYAYRRLKAGIIRGDLTPGSKLGIERLRAEYGVASSTVREALSLLVADSLVTAHGQQGFRVAPMSLADFSDICRLRKHMESLALRDSIAHGDEDWEGEVVSAFHKLSLVNLRRLGSSAALVDAYNERNHAFHEALAGACRSRWVRHFRGVLYDNSRRYRHLFLAKRGVRANVQAEHRALMDAALARDADLACRLNDQHIDRTFEGLATLPEAEIAAAFAGLPWRTGPSRGGSRL